MNPQPTTAAELDIRITVALDASPESLAALEISTALAKWMQAEICGIFVEDDNLVRLCDLPFSTEIGAQSATPRYLTEFCITREFQVLEDAMQRRLEETANRYEVPWRFEVRKGPVTEQLLSAAETTAVIGIGRIGRSEKQQQLGSSARRLLQEASSSILISSSQSRKLTNNSLTLLYTGSPAADRALQQAKQLAQSSQSALTVIVWRDEQTSTKSADQLVQDAKNRLAETPTDLHTTNLHTVDLQTTNLHVVEGHTVNDLLRTAWSIETRMLILPAPAREKLSAWLDMIDIPVLLIP